MTLALMMTATASTKRNPTEVSGKIGAAVTNLTNLKITPVMMPSAQGQHEIRKAIGLDGSSVSIYETYTQSHAHTDGGIAVTQQPDIISGDKLVVGSTTYLVRRCGEEPATTSFGATLILYLTKDER